MRKSHVYHLLEVDTVQSKFGWALRGSSLASSWILKSFAAKVLPSYALSYWIGMQIQPIRVPRGFQTLQVYLQMDSEVLKFLTSPINRPAKTCLSVLSPTMSHHVEPPLVPGDNEPTLS